jgi:hypothetical protein
MGLTRTFGFKSGLHEQDVVPQCVLDLNSFFAFQYPPQLHQNNESNKIISEARSLRDTSILVDPPLSPLPETLPKNITEIANSVLTPEEIKITSYDVPELLQAIRSKEDSRETVTRAFLRRAALAQKLVCNLPSLTLSLDFAI